MLVPETGDQQGAPNIRNLPYRPQESAQVIAVQGFMSPTNQSSLHDKGGSYIWPVGSFQEAATHCSRRRISNGWKWILQCRISHITSIMSWSSEVGGDIGNAPLSQLRREIEHPQVNGRGALVCSDVGGSAALTGASSSRLRLRRVRLKLRKSHVMNLLR